MVELPVVKLLFDELKTKLDDVKKLLDSYDDGYSKGFKEGYAHGELDTMKRINDFFEREVHNGSET